MIARFAVTRRVAVTMLCAAIVVLGIFAAPRLPVALLPSFAPPVVTVTVNYTNASPETIESTVTRPIENAVSRVSGIDILESTSAPGVSSVRIAFDYGTNIDVAAVDVQQQVARIRSSLPNDPALQEPQIIKADPNATPVLILEVTDPSRTQRDLSDIINNELADELASVHGVGSVNASGAAQRAIMVEPDEHRLAAIGLTVNDLMTRIANENVDLPAGVIQIGPKEYGIRTSALYTSPEDVARTVIAVRHGAPIRLADVGIGMSSSYNLDYRPGAANAGNRFAFEHSSSGDTFFIGGGVGYEWNNWLRFDITAEHRSKAAINAFGTFTCGGGCVNGDQFIASPPGRGWTNSG